MKKNKAGIMAPKFFVEIKISLDELNNKYDKNIENSEIKNWVKQY